MVNCSFCGKTNKEVTKIIAGPQVFICNECVRLSQDILDNEGAEEEDIEICKISKEHAEMFKNNGACIRACERVVESAISHWEKAILARDHLWYKLKSTYTISLNTQEQSRIYIHHYEHKIMLKSKARFLREKHDIKTEINTMWNDIKGYDD